MTKSASATEEYIWPQSVIHLDGEWYILNERNGSNIPMQVKNEVSKIELWVNVVTQDKTVDPNSEELGTLSGGNPQARWQVRR